MATSMVKMFPRQILVIPEAASILFTGGFSRRNYPEAIKYQQQAIYSVQIAQEGIISFENKNSHLIICDRGTLDGWAYWPETDRETFFQAIHSTHDLELKRYDWVIHLDTTQESSYDRNNWVRIENHLQADHLNQRIKQSWEGHPQRFIIPSTESFFVKVSWVFSIIEKILAQKSYLEICQSLPKEISRPFAKDKL